MIAVTFLNPITQQRLQVDELDEQMTAGEAIDNLVDRNFVPRAANGQQYELLLKNAGRNITRSDTTLASNGIANGETIVVNGIQRGGC